MAAKWSRTVSAIGEAVSGSRGHDRTGKPHRLSVLDLGGGHRWAGRCSCGWASPVLHDRRTTVQAWDQHRRQEMTK